MRVRGTAGWTLGVLALALTLVSAACRDEGPSGPGSWNGLVRTSTTPPGAVILQIDGVGIQGVEGVDPAQAFARRTAGGGASGQGSETWQVVLVTPAPGSIGFRVDVDELARGAPRAVVTSAADGEDQPLTEIASFSVTMSR